jgi:hypothetical protein
VFDFIDGTMNSFKKIDTFTIQKTPISIFKHLYSILWIFISKKYLQTAINGNSEGFLISFIKAINSGVLLCGGLKKEHFLQKKILLLNFVRQNTGLPGKVINRWVELQGSSIIMPMSGGMKNW